MRYTKNVKRAILFKKVILIENLIASLRKERKTTQEELAAAVGVTRQTIISLENGRYNASLALAYKIAKFFGKGIEDIFIFEED